jgi:probable poly-beta-1,6-N-acetyl-D-glucosamine export protein
MHRQFQALSGIAMLLIVLNHTIQMDVDAPIGNSTAHLGNWPWIILSLVQALGVFGVPIFLFISGAFVSYAAKAYPTGKSYKFIMKSLVHIGWPYLVWSTVFYALVYLQFGKHYDLQGYFRNLVVGYPFHFIPLLIFFYLISPILVRLSRNRGVWMMAGIALYQLGLLALSCSDGLHNSLKLVSPPVIRGTLSQWAIFFPLGVCYSMNIGSVMPHLQKRRPLLAILTILFFILSILFGKYPVLSFLFGCLSSVPAVLVLTLVDRHSIPQLTLLEKIGKRSYGIYLSHLIFLDLILLLLANARPWFSDYRIAFLPLLFCAAILVPMTLMTSLARSPGRIFYRYIFG